MIVLTVLSRSGCGLCDELIDALGPLVAGKARIHIVDITEDEELERRYLIEIPVLKHGDVELCRHRLDSERLSRYMAGLES